MPAFGMHTKIHMWKVLYQRYSLVYALELNSQLIDLYECDIFIDSSIQSQLLT